MKKTSLLVAFFAILLFSGFTTLSITHWKIADGYTVKFTSKNPSGIFRSLKGDVTFDANNLAASHFAIAIDVASINTGNGLMNKVAKSDKWFDAEHYPTIKFTSANISKSGTGYTTTGTLEMHGVQKQIAIPFTFTNNTFKGGFTVNRLDYKVGNAEGMNAHASTSLFIELSIPVEK